MDRDHNTVFLEVVPADLACHTRAANYLRSKAKRWRLPEARFKELVSERPAPWWRRPGVAAALLAAILVLAAILRLKGIAWGLPYSFVNVDESLVVPIAARVARGHLDPRFFYYPSLYFYLLAAAQLVAAPVLWLVKHSDPLTMRAFVLDRSPYFLLGRLLSAGFGVAAVYLMYRIGRATFGRAAGLLAALFLAIVPLAVTYSHMAVTDMTATALSLLALLLLLEGARGRGWRWVMAGAITAGLATSTKYNLGMLVLPATIAAVYAGRDEVRRRVAAGEHAACVWPRLVALRVYLPMLLAFIAGSPFVVLDAPRFVHDFVRQNQIVAHGWLGFEHAGNGFWYNLHTNLGGGMGVILVAIAIAGVVWALWRHTRFDVVVAPYVLIYYIYVSTWKELSDRYLLPIVPLLILFAVRFCFELPSLRPSWRRIVRPTIVAVLVVAFALPLASAVSFDRGLSGTDVCTIAKHWIERTIPPGTVMASEGYGPPLVSLRYEKYFSSAGIAQPAYRLVSLSLPLPGRPDRHHSMAWLTCTHTRYVIISSKVYGRVLAAAADYPRIVAFYSQLARRGKLVKVFRPRPGDPGPVLKIYELPGGRDRTASSGRLASTGR